MDCEIIDHTESDVDNEEFYFESDHLALRGNPDYTSVLRTLAVLEAQRIQASRDLEKLAVLQKTALDDPLKFIQKVKSNEQLAPGPINIAEIPNINFEKYNVTFPKYEKDNLNEKKSNEAISKIGNEDKNDTFNQPWTSEEQRRLEQLLIEYPPEQFEMRRFAKISKALGNRTTKQVSSRVQKFFKKLHSAGMPIPGRIPKCQRNTRLYRFNRLLFRPSTFFPAHDVPVTMPEDDNGSNSIINNQPYVTNGVNSFDKDNKNLEIKLVSVDSQSDDSDLEETPKKINNEVLILKLLERVKKDKENDEKDRPKSIHTGYKCNLCFEEPINGTRWHCNTCLDDSIDYCSDCLIDQLLSTKSHSIDHKFKGLRVMQRDLQSNNSDNESDTDQNQDMENGFAAHYDKDYMMSKFTKNEQYNYLDPNFLP